MLGNTKQNVILPLRPLYIWPMLLIGAGVVWLLRAVDIYSNANLAILFRLWPLILILIGIYILLSRDAPRQGQLIAIGGFVLLLLLMTVGPAVGLWQVTAKSFEKTEAIADTSSATVSVSLAAGNNTVSPLADSQTLFKANLTYLGDVSYDVTGEQTKVIKLENRANNVSFWDLFSADLQMNIWLSPTVPMALTVGNGSGNSTLNLATLMLTDLNISTGSGTITVNLPEASEKYPAVIAGGSGLQTINVPAGASLDLASTGGSGSTRITVGNDVTLNLKYTGGSGTLSVDIPDGAAVRIEAGAGSGFVSVIGVPCASGAECRRDNGTWESSNYSTADHKITIRASIGSGTVTIR